MKKSKYIIGFLFSLLMTIIIAQGCSSAKQIVEAKSGAQLWAENCIRCHNGPSPTEFNDEQWKTIGLHMQDRANLTKMETDKIVEFLKSAN
jgi:cytochrome c1